MVCNQRAVVLHSLLKVSNKTIHQIAIAIVKNMPKKYSDM